MTEEDARKVLENLAKKYLSGVPDYNNLIHVINDKNRPGLPVRGILEKISKETSYEYTDDEKDLIQELIYLFG
jgi:hypothetical protein